MMDVSLTINLTFKDQEMMKRLYVKYGDGLDFAEFCSRFFKQEIRWGLDHGNFQDE